MKWLTQTLVLAAMCVALVVALRFLKGESSIPEPGTLLLAGAGLTALAAYFRRRWRKRPEAEAPFTTGTSS